MGKLMKYEIKGTYKVILGILAIVLILTTILYTYIARERESLVTVFASMLMFGTFLSAFFYIVGSFRKELYEDRGYLTFSLPLTGNQILGTKLIVALLWFLLIGVVTFVYNFIMMFSLATRKIDIDWSEVLNDLKQGISYIDGRTAFFIVLILLITWISTLILIYFSMTLSRVTLRNKKIGGLWFVVFLILSGLIAYFEIKIARALPVYLDLNNWKIITSKVTDYYNNFHMSNEGMFFNIGNGYLSITGNLFRIITGIILFLSTGYLIENKIDL